VLRNNSFSINENIAYNKLNCSNIVDLKSNGKYSRKFRCKLYNKISATIISRRYEAIQLAIQVCVAQNSRRLVQRMRTARDVRPCRPIREHNLMADVIFTITVMN
jgi:hypothetical protein